MKTTFKAALLVGVSAVLFGAALPTFAVSKKGVTVMLRNMTVMPVKKNSAIDCSAYSNKSYTIKTTDKKRWFGKSLYLANISWHNYSLPGGLTKFKLKATAYYKDAKGKMHIAKASAYELGMTGSAVSYGVFTNGFCKGFYTATIQ